MTVNIALFEDLDAVAADAAGALDRVAQGQPLLEPGLFRTLDWYRLLARHCAPEGRLLVARSQTGIDRFGQTRSWLFLSRQGAEARSYANYYSLRAGFSHCQPDQAETPDCIAAIAVALRHAGLSRIEIGPDYPGCLEEAAKGFREAGWAVFRKPDKANWTTRVEARDFAAYWGERPAKLRNTFKRKVKSAGLEVTVHDRFDAAAWSDYEAVYRASWKPEEGSFPFLRALAEREGAAGTLRLGIAKKDGEPVAAQLWLVENGMATIYKLAYAEAAKPMSPGTILGEAMFRRAIDCDGVDRIDYGLGDEPYKADWMTERRVLQRLVAFDPRAPHAWLGIAREKASALVRRARSR